MNEKIRLLQITPDLAIGGLQQVIVNICRTIDLDVFHVQVLCLRQLGPLAEEIEKRGIRVTLLPQNNHGTDYFSFLKVAEFLRNEKIQVIHTHNTQPLFDGTMAAILSRGKQRIIHTDHARTFPDKKRYMFAEWLMSHFVHKMVGVSEHTTENLHKYEKISRKKLATIANGIDGKKYNIQIDVQAKKKELGASGNGPRIGIISRLEKVKGITYLLKAMPGVIRTFPDITLLVAGDGEDKEALQEETLQLGISNNVIFLGPRLDVPEILNVLDIYLLPSLSEGLPMGLLEAMAAGCPVIASNVGGIPGAIAHEKTGILINPGDPDKLTQAIIRLLQDKPLRSEMSKTMRNVFQQHYSADTMTTKYCNLYMGRHD